MLIVLLAITINDLQMTTFSTQKSYALDQPADKPATNPAAAGALVLRRQMIPDAVMGVDAYSILIPDSWKLESDISWAHVKVAPAVTINVSNPALHAQWRHYPRGFYVDGIRENYSRAFPALKAEAEKNLAEGNMTLMGDIIHKLPASPHAFLEQILIPASCPAHRRGQECQS